MTAGNHDDGEKSGDSRFLVDREVQHGFVSPTIDLIAGPTPNNQGLTETIVDVTDDFYIWYDLYAGMFNLNFTGNSWVFAAQSYPATMPVTGGKCWGDIRWPTFQIFNPEPQCFQDWEPLYGYALIATSNPSGVPDSLRIVMGVNQQCFRFAVSLGCNSSEGAYFDNISLGFWDIPAAQQTSAGSAITLGSITADIWMFVNDTFPANETNGLPGSALFDTPAAMPWPRVPEEEERPRRASLMIRRTVRCASIWCSVSFRARVTTRSPLAVRSRRLVRRSCSRSRPIRPQPSPRVTLRSGASTSSRQVHSARAITSVAHDGTTSPGTVLAATRPS